MQWFVDVILPLPLNSCFTYALPETLAGNVQVGCRVVVPFGKKKFYTGIVQDIHCREPEGYEVKDVADVLDARPVLLASQFKLWDWVADYYLCTRGDVYKAALPSGLKLESETIVAFNPDFEPSGRLSDREQKVLSQLESEVQMMMAQGFATDGNIRCSILENLMGQKLFLAQAKLDSLTASTDQVEMELTNRINTAIASLGSEERLAEYFNKPLYKLRNEWRELLTEQNLTSQMQQNVMNQAGSMTPSEIEKFYKRTDKDSLPVISTQYKISQIALYPSKDEAATVVKERLLDFRNRILNGERFSTLATLYSQDPGSAMRGGELGMTPKSMFWPAFSDAASALKPGQISQIVETPDGYHIIQMIEKKGDMINVRHILLKPEYTSEDRDKAFKVLDSLKTKIIADSISFDLAARIYSQDPKSSINGGVMSDPNTGADYFEMDQLKPADYAVLKDMEIGDISAPFESTDNEGRSGNTLYKIIKLDGIKPSHTANLEDDFMVIQNYANNARQVDAIDKFIEEHQKSTLIIIDDLFKNCNFERDGWIK